MNENDRQSLNELAVKIQQHEKAIAQILEILAATNRKITELSSNQTERDYFYSQV
ncbi:hypothetical protein [Oceanobacillus damuensis]|uniref:hypothetical protein n=1 Tax=Oceanobacillus damuensis TaxID=937928 RepID=UPI000AB0D4EF|nr:hypothetical protein [Oceanobacillus damuensis]